MFLSILLIGGVIFATWTLISISCQKDREYISFRESMYLIKLPIVTFLYKGFELRFILDSGANKSILDEKIANEIISYKEKGNTYVCTISGDKRKVPLVEVDIEYDKNVFTTEFQLMDISNTVEVVKKESGIVIHGVIGTDFMKKNSYILDFEKLRCSYKK